MKNPNRPAYVSDVGTIVRVLRAKGTLISNGESPTMDDAINCLGRSPNGWYSLDVKTELLSVVGIGGFLEGEDEFNN